jgi:DNA-directed RNA polymerase specialized sigma24 family protein
MTLSDLSPRRREVALLVGLDYSYREIAADLEMSIHTVHSHVQWIAGKLPSQPEVPAMRKVRAWVNVQQRLSVAPAA